MGQHLHTKALVFVFLRFTFRQIQKTRVLVEPIVIKRLAFHRQGAYHRLHDIDVTFTRCHIANQIITIAHVIQHRHRIDLTGEILYMVVPQIIQCLTGT